ncbi:hypothetical protein IG631_06118 [Alternaria alternata]|jgi:hypothetical protein|nr:hypothetical protein IG631_06118 [Alternaria alternata]
MNHDSSLPLASPTPSALLDLQFVARRNDPSRVLAASFVPFDYLAQLYRVPSLDSPWHSAEVVQPEAADPISTQLASLPFIAWLAAQGSPTHDGKRG